MVHGDCLLTYNKPKVRGVQNVKCDYNAVCNPFVIKTLVEQ